MPKQKDTDKALTIHLPQDKNELLKDIQRAEKRQLNLVEERPLFLLGLDIFLHGLETFSGARGIKLPGYD